jgi:hypothetical protein
MPNKKISAALLVVMLALGISWGQESAVETDEVELPDLKITAGRIVPTFTCKEDGSRVQQFRLWVQNSAPVSLDRDFKIRLADDLGGRLEGCWQADFGGPLPIGPVSFGKLDILWPLQGSACTGRLKVEVDSDHEIRESDEDNNGAVLEFDIPNQNLRIKAIEPIHPPDHALTVQVEIENNGCQDIVKPFSLHLEDSLGNRQAQKIEEMAVGSRIVEFADWPVTCTAKEITLTAVVDADNEICEMEGGDNSARLDYTNSLPDLTADAEIKTVRNPDDTFTGSITVTVQNRGSGPVAEDFVIRLEDGRGWQHRCRYRQDREGTLPLQPGDRFAFTIDWDRQFSTEPGQCRFPDFSLFVDAGSSIPECDESNNTFHTAYGLPIPNLQLVSMTPACIADDYYQVTLVIGNIGCGEVNDDFLIRVQDNDNHTVSKNFSEIGGFLPLLADTTQTVILDTWPVDRTPSTLQFSGQLDPDSEVDSRDPGDNSCTAALTVNDLEASQVTAAAVCGKDGNFSGVLKFTVTNRGGKLIEQDFLIRVGDDKGWRSEHLYARDLGGLLPLPMGDTFTVTIPWDRDFTAAVNDPEFRDFSLYAVVDSSSEICEITDANNRVSATYTFAPPDLLASSMSAACAADGELQLELTVENRGLSDLQEDFNIRIADSAAHTQTLSFTALGGTLPLTTGLPQTLTVSRWPFACTGPFIDFTVTLDPDDRVCELPTAGNTLDWTYHLNEPGLVFGRITRETLEDNTIEFKVSVANRGRGDARGVSLHLYDNTVLIYTQEFDLPAGAATSLTFTAIPAPEFPDHHFRLLLDEDQKFCECKGSLLPL